MSEELDRKVSKAQADLRRDIYLASSPDDRVLYAAMFKIEGDELRRLDEAAVEIDANRPKPGAFRGLAHLYATKEPA